MALSPAAPADCSTAKVEPAAVEGPITEAANDPAATPAVVKPTTDSATGAPTTAIVPPITAAPTITALEESDDMTNL